MFGQRINAFPNCLIVFPVDILYSFTFLDIKTYQLTCCNIIQFIES
jgi:hypothetical protein